MSPTILAARAVSSEFAKQLLLPILIGGVAVYAVLMAVIIWLTVALSPLWLLLAILPTFLFFIGMVLWIIARVIANRIAPDMNKTQKKATKKVVGQVGKVAEQLGTPRFVLLFRIIKDAVFPPKRRRTLISELADTPGQLHRDFEDLRKLF